MFTKLSKTKFDSIENRTDFFQNLKPEFQVAIDCEYVPQLILESIVTTLFILIFGKVYTQVFGFGNRTTYVNVCKNFFIKIFTQRF